MLRITDELIEEFKEFEKRAKAHRMFRYYGMHKLANAYLGLPNWFPIDYFCYLEHGIGYQLGQIDPRLKISQGEIVLVNNEDRKKVALNAGKKKVFNIGPLFIHYRLMNKIEQNPDAQGTISFPAHSTLELHSVFDWDKYAQELYELPPQYHPVSACLYWKDILHGRHKTFQKYNIPVYTCGHFGMENFAENLYGLLKQNKYITSNHLGSYASYSMEMGIPFFLYGSSGHFEPKDEHSTTIEVVKAVRSSNFFIEMEKTFWLNKTQLEQQPPQITSEQLFYHNQLIDKPNWVSPRKVKWTILLSLPWLAIQKIWSRFF